MSKRIVIQQCHGPGPPDEDSDDDFVPGSFSRYKAQSSTPTHPKKKTKQQESSSNLVQVQVSSSSALNKQDLGKPQVKTAIPSKYSFKPIQANKSFDFGTSEPVVVKKIVSKLKSEKLSSSATKEYYEFSSSDSDFEEARGKKINIAIDNSQQSPTTSTSLTKTLNPLSKSKALSSSNNQPSKIPVVATKQPVDHQKKTVKPKIEDKTQTKLQFQPILLTNKTPTSAKSSSLSSSLSSSSSSSSTQSFNTNSKVNTTTSIWKQPSSATQKPNISLSKISSVEKASQTTPTQLPSKPKATARLLSSTNSKSKDSTQSSPKPPNLTDSVASSVSTSVSVSNKSKQQHIENFFKKGETGKSEFGNNKGSSLKKLTTIGSSIPKTSRKRKKDDEPAVKTDKNGTPIVPYFNNNTQIYSDILVSATRDEVQLIEPKDWNDSQQRLGGNSWFTAEFSTVMSLEENILKLEQQNKLVQAIKIEEKVVKEKKPGWKRRKKAKDEKRKQEARSNETKNEKKESEASKKLQPAEVPSKAKKYRIYPTQSEQKTLNQWIEHSR